MFNKPTRVTLGVIGVFIGIVFAILPGSILFLVAGLFMLSFDFPLARKWLRKSQKVMSWGAGKLDAAVSKRRYSR